MNKRLNSPMKFLFFRELVGIDCHMIGAGSRNRTGTVSPPRDFESRASTYSAIPATRAQLSLIYSAGATTKRYARANACPRPRLLHVLTAINGDIRAGQKGGFVGCQIGDQTGDFFGLA